MYKREVKRTDKHHDKNEGVQGGYVKNIGRNNDVYEDITYPSLNRPPAHI